jgi:uncharacterized protein YoxC
MPGLTSKIKRGAKYLINKANALHQDVKDEMNGASTVHTEVQHLYNKVKAIMDLEGKKLDPQVKEAAQCMLNDLKAVLKEDSSHGPLTRHHPSGQYDLAEKSIDIIFKYQPKLEAAPGFWNQIKAHINTFIEKISGEKNVFETEGTAFSKSKSFQDLKQSVTELRDEMKSELEPDEPETKFEHR